MNTNTATIDTEAPYIVRTIGSTSPHMSGRYTTHVDVVDSRVPAHKQDGTVQWAKRATRLNDADAAELDEFGSAVDALIRQATAAAARINADYRRGRA